MSPGELKTYHCATRVTDDPRYCIRYLCYFFNTSMPLSELKPYHCATCVTDDPRCDDCKQYYDTFCDNFSSYMKLLNGLSEKSNAGQK
ncbi:hypothetical protein WH47_05445 [Habropoda laboriosa]|uniref:Uncharacterized protein n=1 Tax=Habropoda laboriosa TaxID=597456 RepID=A0A0L7QTD2_9HYME|nr:hypothetical protein WH47_05445 [Habropoda laboriosa]